MILWANPAFPPRIGHLHHHPLVQWTLTFTLWNINNPVFLGSVTKAIFQSLSLSICIGSCSHMVSCGKCMSAKSHVRYCNFRSRFTFKPVILNAVLLEFPIRFVCLFDCVVCKNLNRSWDVWTETHHVSFIYMIFILKWCELLQSYSIVFAPVLLVIFPVIPH